MKNRIRISALAVTITCVGAIMFVARRHAHDLRRQAAQKTQKLLEPMTNAPAEILSGKGHFRSVIHYASSDGNVQVGVWECPQPTHFRWRFGLDESVYIQKGTVAVKYLGREFVLGPGDTAFFLAETEAEWEVQDSVEKSFVLEEPGRFLRLWRKITRHL